VIDADLRLLDLDRRHWANWWRLMVPPRAWGLPAWALAVVEDEDHQDLVRLIVAGEGGRGQVPLQKVAWRGVGSGRLEELARQLEVGAVVVVTRSAFATLSRQLDPALKLRQDLVEQGLLALRALKGLAGKGVWTYPELLGLLPAPSYESVQRTFDLLVPDDTAMAAYVIEDDRQRLHASVLARKRGGHIDRVTTHRALRAAVSEAALARNWQKEVPRVLAAVEAELGKPSLGIFLEKATLLRIMTGPSDQLSRELSARRVILDPAPAWLLGLLGGATVAAVAGRGARVLAAMLPAAARERASGLAQRATTAMRDSGMHPFALLGFDPLELWRHLQAFYKPQP
jgi:hypothetical protein